VTFVFMIRPVWFVVRVMLSNQRGSARFVLACILVLLAGVRLAARAVRAAHERRHQSWKLA